MAKTKAQAKIRDATQPKAALRSTLVDRSQSMALNAEVAEDAPLTEKMKLFAKNWAYGDSINNAAIRAGYTDNPSWGYRLSKRPNILALYNQYKQMFEEESKMTRKKVMDMQLEAYEMAKLMSEPSSMVAAAREVGKLCGYYEPVRKEININVNGSVTMQQMTKMSDADLLKIIEDGSYADPALLGGPDGDEDGD